MNNSNLLRKIHAKEARIAVVGLGYVGLPLACEFAQADIEVIGFDVDNDKVNMIN